MKTSFSLIFTITRKSCAQTTHPQVGHFRCFTIRCFAKRRKETKCENIKIFIYSLSSSLQESICFLSCPLPSHHYRRLSSYNHFYKRSHISHRKSKDIWRDIAERCFISDLLVRICKSFVSFWCRVCVRRDVRDVYFFYKKFGNVRAYHVPRNKLLQTFLRINLYYDGILPNLRW